MKRAAEVETLDIEDLLIMAYRANKVDQITPEGILSIRGPSLNSVSSTALVMAHVARGTAVDTSKSGAMLAGRAGQMRAVENDLIDVHDAVLGLPRFYAHLTGGARFVVWDDDTLQRAEVNGWEVIRSGSPERPSYRLATRRHDGPPAPEPQAFHNGVPFPALASQWQPEAPTVPLYPIEPRVVLVQNGRAGTRPDVSPLVITRYAARYAGRRKEVVGYDRVYETLPSVVALERATYAVWHCVLGMLVDRLQGLSRFRVTGPRAPEAPWTDVVVEPTRRPRTLARSAVVE